MSQRTGRRALGSLTAAAVLAVVPVWGGSIVGDAQAAAPPAKNTDFVVETVLTGLTEPVAARVAPDGRIVVAERAGVIKLFDGPRDRTPVIVADIRRQVHDFWDRGLTGLALDPEWTTQPYVYALYTFNQDPFDAERRMPRWGAGLDNDGCPSTPGPGSDGCVTTARIGRFLVKPDGTGGPEEILLDSDATSGICFQSPSHNVDHLAFGADGRLYATVGEGASFGGADYGQNGGKKPDTTNPVVPANPCNDAPNFRGRANVPATGEGGALRSQAARSTSTDGYTPLNGALLRMDKNSGAAPPDNPLVGNSEVGDDRIVAYGLRNPFRFGFRPGTNEVWIGDVGWNTWEELNRAVVGPGRPVVNFGWPCYEGPARQPTWDALNNNMCESLYADVDAGRASAIRGRSGVSPYSPPVIPIPHDTSLGGCRVGSSSVIGGVFSSAANWPTALKGAYVFGDYGAACLYAMPLGADGDPDFSRLNTLVVGTGVVDLSNTADGSVMWVDIGSGEVYALRRAGTNVAPTAVIEASPTSGPAPLAVTLSGHLSTDGNIGDPLSFAWDLDADGAFDDASGIKVTTTFTASTTVSMRATDSGGLTDVTSVLIAVGETPPVIRSITSSTGTGPFTVGQTVTLTADVADNLPIPPTGHRWDIVGQHCAPGGGACHDHTNIVGAVGTGPVAQFVAPDHELDFHITVTLTVTDAAGLTATSSIELSPLVSSVSVLTEPAGLRVTAGDVTKAGTATVEAFAGGGVAVSADGPQTLSGKRYNFLGWIDEWRAAPQRRVVVGDVPTAYIARYGQLLGQIDVGGPAGAGGWTADNGTGGSIGQLAGTVQSQVPGVTAPIATSVRRGNATWTAALPTGVYRVTIVAVEPDPAVGPGGRTFSVSSEGAIRLTGVDARALAGSAGTAVGQSFDVTVTDGILDVGVTGLVGEPVVSAILITQIAADLNPAGSIRSAADGGYTLALRAAPQAPPRR